MTLFDHHTHNQNAPAGRAVICLPRTVLDNPDTFTPRAGAMYSAGIHPWWTDDEVESLWHGVEKLAAHPQVVALGETGFDRLKGDLHRQEELFARHAALAESTGKYIIIHCVRAYDLLLQARTRLRPAVPWQVHGFRGKPALASQLLAAGFHLSFGMHANPETLNLIPRNELRLETDDSGLTIEEVQSSLFL